MGHAGGRVEAILIAGPTASGKSALAIRLAARLGGTIVNADSMQVYRDLRILTARPSPADEARVPHRLYGHVDGADAYSVSRWLADATATMVALRRDARLPILVGGTGLFFKALTAGLSAIPPIPDTVRAEVRGWAAERAPEALHALLAARDPATAARLRPSDPQRIVRALEVVLATGQGLATFQERRDPAVLRPERYLAVTLAPDREGLRKRIDARFDDMVAAGGVEEVRDLAARALPADRPILRAIGVPSMLRHLDGVLSLDEAITQAKTASRQYLKRQATFFRHQLPAFRAIEPDRAEDYVLAQSV